ncbi:hypothetical protein NQ314_016674 [Rhamnusium bicolor]|uniref:DDE-1 domain-containing protein n=1 Tax=Rhamnusium bicolor TaxID=1586634 RepID=A0AAV8WVC9_9CUCU|nr:hypothetical protein NQ314_016674 [Rhamnusium bicolor]
MAPPMIVFTYTRVPGYISANIPESWGIGNSENGWMCSATFYEYMTNIFEPWLTEQKIARPIVFFVDDHVSHLTLHLSNFCVEKQIELKSLFPNSTHLLQPMDVAVFRPLKHAWKLEVQQWRLDNSGHKLQKQHFGKVLEAALKHISEDTIRNGFKVSGLCPFNEHNVKFTKLSKTSLSEENRGGNLAINAKILLSGLEDRIGRERKNSFEMCLLEGNIEWNGPIEEKTFYEIWKSIKLETNERRDDGRNNEEAVVLQPLHSSPPLNLNNEKNTDYESAHPHCTPIKDAISEEVNLQLNNINKENYGPFLKMYKPPDSADSYRPICLVSCLLKVLEKMIKNRLQWWLEKQGKLRKTQDGLRQKYCIGKITSIDEISENLVEVKFLRASRKVTYKFVWPQVEDEGAIQVSEVVKELTNPIPDKRGGLLFSGKELKPYLEYLQ